MNIINIELYFDEIKNEWNCYVVDWKNVVVIAAVIVFNIRPNIWLLPGVYILVN